MSASVGDVLTYYDPAALAVEDFTFSPAERAILERINQKVAAAVSLGAILDFIFEAIRPVSPCDRISLAFVEEQGLRVVSHITRAAYEPILLTTGYAEDLAGSSLAPILQRGTPRIIHDLERYHQQKPDSRSTRILLREGVRSSMTCPLRVDGRAVGLLFRSSRRPDAYRIEHMRLHLAMAERISQAVEKTWQIEQLTQANRAYFEMLGFVTHELKSPIASMIMDAQLLAEGYAGAVNEQQREKLRRMIAKGQFLLELVGEYLDLARLEGQELTPELRTDVDLVQEVVRPAIELTRAGFEAEGMRLVEEVAGELGPVHGDPTLLKIVLVNLLGNAAKYGRRGGVARLQVRREGPALVITVWNEGPGFPPEQRHRLFRKFSRLDAPELRRRKGTGVGLYTVWRIVQAHHGRVEAHSEPGAWAEFRVTIPQPLSPGPGDPQGPEILSSSAGTV